MPVGARTGVSGPSTVAVVDTAGRMVGLW
jgi:hypothetical protein